ncbi:MAG: IS4 family transposase, partial [Aquimonas sp.]|nr:IS4 family transposase [Aquimonas sp.]MCG6118951.1 IS4 family transposase [Aquimonas sp.]
MHASTILRCCIGEILDTMHATRCRRLLDAVEALVAGRRLTLTELARQWPGAERAHAPLKAL